MGREVRRVPADWVHPLEEGQDYEKPLFDGSRYAIRLAAFEAMVAKVGLEKAIEDDGPGPDPADYMPAWTPEQATHYMMYETVTEGTPISPAFPSPEELARWLADTGANSGAFRTASYEQWLRVCRGGYAPSLVMDAKGMRSGVEM